MSVSDRAVYQLLATYVLSVVAASAFVLYDHILTLEDEVSSPDSVEVIHFESLLGRTDMEVLSIFRVAFLILKPLYSGPGQSTHGSAYCFISIAI